MKIKRTSYLLAPFLFMVSQAASADFLGIQVGGGYWDYGTSGSISYLSNTAVDLKDDLQLSDDKDSFTYVIFEHPVPLLPNVKIKNSGLASSGSGTLTQSFNYGGVSYNVSESIDTDLVLDHQDVTLYYEILDNIVSVDLGLTGKMIDGYVAITRAGVTEKNELSGTIPMLYAAAGASIPFADLYLGVEGNMIGIGDSEITDITAKVAYETSFYLGIEAGVRSVTIKLDDLDNSSSNMKFSGPFIDLFFHF